MPWFDDPDNEASEPKGPSWWPENNGGGAKKESGCLMAIPRACWTVLKVSFNFVFRGIKPDYVV